jgi:hypothetical protein
MIWDVLPGSGFFSIPDQDFFYVPDPGVKKLRIRNTTWTFSGHTQMCNDCVSFKSLEKMDIEKLSLRANSSMCPVAYAYANADLAAGLNFIRIPDPSLSGPETLRWLNQEVDYSNSIL